MSFNTLKLINIIFLQAGRYLTFQISDGTSFDKKQVYSMSKKTVCRNNQIQITINYQKLQKNIGKLIKILNQVDSLFIIPRQNKATLYPQIIPQTFNSDCSHVLRSNIEPKEALIQQQYLLNSNEAIQLIWRSAYIIKQLGCFEVELKQLEDDKYKGLRNQLSQIILKLGKQIQLLSKKKGYHTLSMQVAKKQLLRLDALREKINNAWKNAHQKQTSTIKSIFQESYVGLIKIQFQPRERQLVLNHLFSKIIEFDRALFRDSILFILEIQQGKRCIVVLEQSYPSFIVQLKQLQQLIGLCSYYEGLQNFNLFRELIETNNMSYQMKLCVMCHRCRDIQIRDTKKEKKDFICSSKQMDPDPTSTPYAYQQIMLFSNYAAIPQLYTHKSSKTKEKEANIILKKYVHPFSKTNSTSCSRYLCEQCVNYYQAQIKKKAKKDEQKNDSQNQKNNQKQLLTKEQHEKKKKKRALAKLKLDSNQKSLIRCQFCECQCECERCNTLDCLNKFIALYCTFGGSLERILEHMIFWAESNKTCYMKIISAEDVHRYCSKIDERSFKEMLKNKKKPIMSKAQRKMEIIVRRSKRQQKSLKQLLKKQQEEINKYESSQKNGDSSSKSSNTNKSNQNSLSSLDSPDDSEKHEPNAINKIIQEQEFNANENQSQKNMPNHINMIQQPIKTIQEQISQNPQLNEQKQVESSFEQKQPEPVHKVKLQYVSNLQQRLNPLASNSPKMDNENIIKKANNFVQPKLQMAQSASESQQIDHDYLHLKQLFRMIIKKQEAPAYSLNQSQTTTNKKVKYQYKNPLQQSYQLDDTNNEQEKNSINANHMIVPLDEITPGKIRVKRHRRRREQIQRQQQQAALLSIVKQQYIPNRTVNEGIPQIAHQNCSNKVSQLQNKNGINVYKNLMAKYIDEDDLKEKSNKSQELFFDSDDQK